MLYNAMVEEQTGWSSTGGTPELRRTSDQHSHFSKRPRKRRDCKTPAYLMSSFESAEFSWTIGTVFDFQIWLTPMAPPPSQSPLC